MLDDDPDSEITFNSKHITSIRFKYGPESVERNNICRVKYYAPERNYEMSEILLYEDDGVTPLAWSIYQDEIDKVGEQPLDLSLPFCPSPSQAQRIARRLFKISRADTGIMNFNLSGLAAWGARVVTVDIPDMPSMDGNKSLIGTPRVDDAAGTVEIPFIVNPDLPAWVPAEDEALALPDIPEIQFESELEQPDAPSQYGLVQKIGGDYELRQRFESVSGATSAEANYRLYDESDLPLTWSGMTEIGLNYAGQVVGSDLTGEKCDFRVRMIDSDGEVSYFSDEVQAASLAIDNTKPSEPDVTAYPDSIEFPTILNFDFDIPDELRIVQLRYDFNGSVTVVDTYPTESYELNTAYPNTNGTYHYYISVKTSDGTESDIFHHQITINDGGGGS